MQRTSKFAGALAGAIALAVVGSAPAWAEGPEHVMDTVPHSATLPAGSFCDFTYGEEGTVSTNALFFEDRAIVQTYIHIEHINRDTGYTLTEDTSFVQNFSDRTGELRLLGGWWKLRDADGNPVLFRSGQVVIDAATGQIVSFTPGIRRSDFAGTICPLLGGQPA